MSKIDNDEIKKEEKTKSESKSDQKSDKENDSKNESRMDKIYKQLDERDKIFEAYNKSNKD